MILRTPVIGRPVAKVRSLVVLPTSFNYGVAMVSLREPANVRDTRRRFSALSWKGG